MSRALLYLPAFLWLLLATACSTTPWKSGGAVELSALTAPWPAAAGSNDATVAAPPRANAPPLSLVLPADWYWLRRGDDLVATRDGIFLQNITLERFHCAQREQSQFMFPRISLTAWQWPLRTLTHLKTPLAPAMTPTALSAALLASRGASPGVSEVQVFERGETVVAGRSAGRVEYGFRVGVMGRQPAYRAVSVILLVDDWCYVVTYAATQRYYFARDAATFAAVLQSLQLAAREGGAG